MTTTDTTPAMFSGAELVETTAAEYDARIDAIQDRLAACSPDVTHPRASRDETRDASQRIRGARAFLSGEYDRTYAGPWGPYTDIQGYREHYALDALRTALHHVVWAEHYAGLRDRDSAMSLDPWRN